MPEPGHSPDAPTVAFELEQPVSPAQLDRFRNFGLAFLIAGIVLVFTGLGLGQYSETQKTLFVQKLSLVESQILNELNVLNESPRIPDPLALKAAVELASTVKSGSGPWHWYGQLYEQRLQLFFSQLLESLGRPISGLDSDLEDRHQRERGIRIEALPKLQRLMTHLESGTNGPSAITTALGLLVMIASAVFLGQWLYRLKTDALRRRINTLGRAIHSQDQADLKQVSASQALQGVIDALEKSRHVEHRHAIVELSRQFEELRSSGHKVLEFANSFHKLSSHATGLAKKALTNEQRNLRADGTMDIMKNQLDGLRDDMRTAAQGLRKAGQVSRQILTTLQNPNQMTLDLTDPGANQQMQELVEESQRALKEAIEGLVLASQKINTGQFEARKLEEHFAVNHTAWSNLLEEIEQQSEAASRESAEALRLAKQMIQSGQPALETEKGKPALT